RAAPARRPVPRGRARAREAAPRARRQPGPGAGDARQGPHEQIPPPSKPGAVARARGRAREPDARHRDPVPAVRRHRRSARPMKPSIAAKLASLDSRLKEIDARLSDPEVANDRDNFRRLSQERAEISPVVDAFAEYRR